MLFMIFFKYFINRELAIILDFQDMHVTSQIGSHNFFNLDSQSILALKRILVVILDNFLSLLSVDSKPEPLSIYA